MGLDFYLFYFCAQLASSPANAKCGVVVQLPWLVAPVLAGCFAFFLRPNKERSKVTSSTPKSCHWNMPSCMLSANAQHLPSCPAAHHDGRVLIASNHKLV